MKLIAFLFFVIFFTSCEGYYRVSGTVYENRNNEKVPLDSVVIRIYANKNWMRTETLSSSGGGYDMSGTTTPKAIPYYFVFEKKGFITDTIMKQGKKGKTIISCDHTMARR